MTAAVDLFSGPRGWDVAARDLGIDTLGIENNAVACATSRAAGFRTLEGDVTAYGPFHPDVVGYLDGFIGSPPCQPFSMTGNGAGRRALSDVLKGVKELEARQGLTVVHDDARIGLVLEPLRWVLEAMDVGLPYRWVALEQVPEVLPVWQAVGEVLEGEGYSVRTGYVFSEQYGVAQTRKRAILTARLDLPAAWPVATHSRFYTGSPEKRDPGVLPWVSMREALKDLRDLDPEWWEQRSNYSNGGARGSTAAERGRSMRPTTHPSFTITSKGFQWEDPLTRVRSTVEEMALLQSFPAGYPWQGGRGDCAQQVGNAIPPLMARAILKAVMD